MKYTRLALALAMMALGTIAAVYVVSRAVASVAGEQDREAANAPPAQPFTVVLLPPKLKVRLQAPPGWTLRVEPQAGHQPPTVTVRFPDGRDITLNFFPGEEGKPATQKSVEEQVRLDRLRNKGRLPAGKPPDILGMPSKTGLGAYWVEREPVFVSGPGVVYGRSVGGRFATGGVVVGFWMVDTDKGADYPLALKFIAEGITVE